MNHELTPELCKRISAHIVAERPELFSPERIEAARAELQGVPLAALRGMDMGIEIDRNTPDCTPEELIASRSPTA